MASNLHFKVIKRPTRPKKSRSKAIRIINARANNLKNVSVDIPKGVFTVVSGVSGSGKSSLVKDVLEREARRRYLESLSMYERQGTSEGPERFVEISAAYDAIRNAEKRAENSTGQPSPRPSAWTVSCFSEAE